jgi:hypothetical protein
MPAKCACWSQIKEDTSQSHCALISPHTAQFQPQRTERHAVRLRNDTHKQINPCLARQTWRQDRRALMSLICRCRVPLLDHVCAANTAACHYAAPTSACLRPHHASTGHTSIQSLPPRCNTHSCLSRLYTALRQKPYVKCTT